MRRLPAQHALDAPQIPLLLYDILLPVWMAFRTVMRAIRWEGMETNRFTHFLFSEWGDLKIIGQTPTA